ncbi:5'-methylthioadenosine/S-adenosylhomocysteine nucleosidase [bioreactor metagenome]|uniref:adenosylhomocysteine nucleosidase n=1 Tax=bioreactor metagenome TaxID=1076179 RepID=A0A644YB90_9ZZZZ|nr:5'-methylthioadenosine/S-adenosylhomocysteine nucleosidase [Candidatus Metalachnospira sp.]
MKFKKLLSAAIAMSMVLSTVPMTSFAAEKASSSIGVEVVKDGKGTDIVFGDATGAPFIDANSRTLVPIRAVAEALDVDVKWDADSKTAQLLSKTVEKTVSFTLGTKEYVYNAGEEFTTAEMDTEAVIVSGRIYAPCRYIAEALGYNVLWDSENNKVVVADEEVRKPLLIQGAMDMEINLLLDAVENKKEVKLGEYYYVKGTYKGYPVVVSRTEQGVSNSAVATALAIDYFDPIAVINQGTSGGHDPELTVYDIVLGEHTSPNSAWKSVASAQGKGVDYTALTQIGVQAYDPEKGEFANKSVYDGDKTILTAAENVADTYKNGDVVKGTIGTSDEWNNQYDRMVFLNKFFGSSCEEMESNSVASICETYDVPYLAIRVISNTAVNPAPTEENSFYKAAQYCQQYVLTVADNYINKYISINPAEIAETGFEVTYDQNLRPLLIQGAMWFCEVNVLVENLENAQKVQIGNYQFWTGTINGYPVVVSQTEQGLSNSAVTTALAIEYFNPIAVINQGTSGGHDPEIKVGDIVLGEKAYNYASWKSDSSAKDKGVDYKAITMGGTYSFDSTQGKFAKQLYYPGDEKLITAAESVSEAFEGEYKNNVVRGVIASSDEWNNQYDRMLWLHETYGDTVEEMESASAAQICKTFNVPCLGIRVVSNSGMRTDTPAVSFKQAGLNCQEYVLDVAEAYIASLK